MYPRKVGGQERVAGGDSAAAMDHHAMRRDIP